MTRSKQFGLLRLLKQVASRIKFFPFISKINCKRHCSDSAALIQTPDFYPSDSCAFNKKELSRMYSEPGQISMMVLFFSKTANGF